MQKRSTIISSVTKSNGFTLLEMMVALSLFSLAALSLVKLQSYTIQSTGEVEQNSLARITIQNIAVEILTNPTPPSIGEDSGTIINAGQEWRWQSNTALTDDSRILRVDIELTGSNARQSLTIVRSVVL